MALFSKAHITAKLETIDGMVIGIESRTGSIESMAKLGEVIARHICDQVGKLVASPEQDDDREELLAELEELRADLEEAKAQLAGAIEPKRRGRPPKKAEG